MPEREPTETTNLDIHGDAPLPWSRAAALLPRLSSPGATVGQGTPVLGTVSPGGRPHAAGSGALWHDGELYFTTSPTARKGRNLAANPACTLGVSLAGIDLISTGTAIHVTDSPTLEMVAARYRDDGWPVTVAGNAFTAPLSAPSAGPPPWWLYRLAFDQVVGVATTEPNGATRWRFTA